ncbi:MAG: FecR family protein, partial [Aquaticitalea sp.]
MNTEQAKALFTKYLNNECSNEERDLLETFLDSYQGADFLNEQSQIDEFNDSKERVWSNILTQVEEQSKSRKQFPFKSYTIYAIAASLVLFLAVTIFFQKQNNQSIPTMVFEQPIEIGTDKATLTLENGNTIALEKGKIYNNANVDSNGENLVYHTDDNNTKETVYNYLTIPRGGQFYVELSDGTKVWLNSESKLKYPVIFKEGQPRNVELVYGEAYFDVSPSTQHQGASFSVNSTGQSIEVLGTEFNVKAYQDEANT